LGDAGSFVLGISGGVHFEAIERYVQPA